MQRKIHHGAPAVRKTPLAIALTLMLTLPQLAAAQEADPNAAAEEPAGTSTPEDPNAKTLDAVTVVGIRQSLQKAAEVKREASQVMDVITSEDVGKLPDENVAEALQRVTGVQITRVFGEGQSVSIRGLQQVRIEVDNRTLLGYSARLSPPENEQLGRNSGLDTVPSGLFGRLEVRKSPIASQIEGGLGGSVNLVTPDPFDYREPVFLGRVQAAYSDGVEKTEPALSLFMGRTFADNRFGMLFAVDYQKRTKLSQAFERNSFFNQVNATTGAVIQDSDRNGVADISGDRLHYEQFITDRTRAGANFEAQFKANEYLTFKTEVIYSELKTEREQEFLAYNYSKKLVTNATVTDNFILAGNTTGSIQQAALFRAEPTKSYLGAVSANWYRDRWNIDLDLSYSRGTIDQVIRQITLQSINANIPGSFNYTDGPVPTLNLGAFDPSNFANYRVAANGVRANRLIGELDERVAKLDFNYSVDAGDFRNVSFGARGRQLAAQSNAYRTQLTPAVGEINGFLRNTDANNFLSEVDGAFPRGFVVADVDPNWVLARVGGNPLLPNAARDYDLTEDSKAVYAMADFEGEFGKIPYRANAGARFVKTDLEVDTLLSVATSPTTTVLVPVNDQNSYSNFLPSGNIVFYMTPDFLVRLAASKTMQQAGIAELAPSIFVNQTNRTATGGNAQLKPIEAKQGDVSLEYYYDKNTVLSFAVFYKNVSNFIANETTLQTFPGFEALGPIPYTRPSNIGSAKVKGFEVGYQTFFDALPAPFDGFGLIANYTYSNAEDDNGFPLVGVSKNSYNLIGIYEKGRFSSRLAYNGRDEAAFSFTEGRPDFIAERSQLDFQLGWQLNDKYSLQFLASNLLPKASATIEYSQIGPDALNSYALSETTYSLGFRGKF